MAFFKHMWRNNSRHKKLSEEWALATSLQDFSKNMDDFEDYEPTAFHVKYLGNTVVEAARSEEATADAVKQVITTAKPNWKKLQRVSLYVSPKGIEMCDTVSGETLLQVSIYKISYCSADATHDQVFAFINSTGDSTDNDSCPSSSESDGASSKDSDGTLVLHAFLCQKRKIAQNVTITVAKSFEKAFEIWQDENQRRSRTSQSNQVVKKQNQRINVHHDTTDFVVETDNNVRNMLIDFGSDLATEICSKDHTQYFQNTWVSFEDEQMQTNDNMKNYNEKFWEQNIIISS